MPHTETEDRGGGGDVGKVAKNQRREGATRQGATGGAETMGDR